MLHVTDAKYIGDYKISVEFNDGCRFVADFESVIKSDHRPIVQQLADINTFRDFALFEITFPGKILDTHALNIPFCKRKSNVKGVNSVKSIKYTPLNTNFVKNPPRGRIFNAGEILRLRSAPLRMTRGVTSRN